MKFWKINEKALRCVLHFEELKEQNIRLEDMMLGTDSAREFLNDIIIRACMELDMELRDQQLSVHVMPLPGERLDLLISEVSEEELARLKQKNEESVIEEDDMLPESHAPSAPAVVPGLLQKKLLFAVYSFSSLEPVQQLSKRLDGNYVEKSSLWKEPQSGIYYLCLHEKRKKFRQMTDIAGDYGALYSIDPIIEFSLREHCEGIIKKHAVKQLARL